MKITTSLEGYLNNLFKLNKQKTNIRVTDIAIAMKVQKPSVNKALNILKEEELINYEKYKDITLTNKGMLMAKHINKRHELFKNFLVNSLKVNEELADSEAEKLAHCVSCHTTAKLEGYIEEILKNKS